MKTKVRLFAHLNDFFNLKALFGKNISDTITNSRTPRKKLILIVVSVIYLADVD